MPRQPIYLDNQATTAVDPRVLAAMLPYFTETYGNPHSNGHPYGWEANEALEQSRSEVAALIGADAREIVFTSGATEACNIAIRGVAQAEKKRRARGGRSRIVTLATEHACVLSPCADLAREGWEVVVLPVGRDGIVDLDAFAEAVDERTLLVSAMLANNEIGVLQPIAEISAICRANGATLHTDATQAIGKIPVDVHALGVDLLSLSAHKFYGPMGIGALYVRWRPKVKLAPLASGGGQERGIRPGTAPVPLAAGLGEACCIAGAEMATDARRIRRLTGRLWDGLRQRCPQATLYGHPSLRIPGNLSVGFPGQSGEKIVDAVSRHVAISTGSACSSSEAKPSYVLAALGIGAEAAQSAVRLSVGRFNTEAEMDAASIWLSKKTNVPSYEQSGTSRAFVA